MHIEMLIDGAGPGDLGSARARLRGARAVTREALSDYEKTMLLALEETDTALVTYRQQQERLVKLTNEVRESARAANIARVRYREGVADYLLLLDAERTQLQAEDSAAQAETDVFTAFVGLYRALGGMRDTMPKEKESRSNARFRPGPEQSPGTLFQLRSGGSDR